MARCARFPLAGALLLLAAACAPMGARGLGDVPPVALPEGISPEAWTHALAAHQAAVAAGLTASSLLTVIDYSRPSSEERLVVVDLATGAVLAREYVAHASRSGGLWATAFSNRDGSHQSSLGAFLTAGTYSGVRGLSLRLRGLEPGINDRAWQRGIVIHGTPNVSAARARKGQLGRTQGCPAVSPQAVRPLVRLIAGGTLVFAWYPERGFLRRSAFVDRAAADFRLATAG